LTVYPSSRWDTTDRLEVFTDVLLKRYLPCAVSDGVGVGDALCEIVREQPLGEMWVVDSVTRPHVGHRTRRQMIAPARDVVGLQYVVAGREIVRQGDEVLSLGPGDLMVSDSDITGSYEILETVHKYTLVVPRALAVSLLPAVYSPASVRAISRCQDGPVRPLFGLLSALSDTLATMSPEASQRLAALVVQMLADLDPALCSDQPVVGRCAARDLCERVLSYIEANLGDSTLSPATIAAAHFVSTRTLYSALDRLDTTLAAHIRARRLARCYADLMTGDDRVGEVATRWGFVNLAHFSRVFAKQYGFSPSHARRRAQ
jgi:AraC-like DNA-binding protein